MTDLRFACPRCRVPLDSKLVCLTCNTTFEYRDGIYHFLLPERELSLKPFLSQYQKVRQLDGNTAHSIGYYQMLPFLPDNDPDISRWYIRRQSFENLVDLLPSYPLKILDLGAGNCWLTYRLANLGHNSVSVDISKDCDDGLSAWRHYPLQFTCVQADFDALPFMPGQFNTVIFNASLHYSSDVDHTLKHARTMLMNNGMIFVIDSPTFRNSLAGKQMISDRDEYFRTEIGFREVVQCGLGYLTRKQMFSAGFRFHKTNAGFLWELRRLWSGVKLRREPAAFGIWEGRLH